MKGCGEIFKARAYTQYIACTGRNQVLGVTFFAQELLRSVSVIQELSQLFMTIAYLLEGAETEAVSDPVAVLQ